MNNFDILRNRIEEEEKIRGHKSFYLAFEFTSFDGTTKYFAAFPRTGLVDLLLPYTITVTDIFDSPGELSDSILNMKDEDKVDLPRFYINSVKNIKELEGFDSADRTYEDEI